MSSKDKQGIEDQVAVTVPAEKKHCTTIQTSGSIEVSYAQAKLHLFDQKYSKTCKL